jgi:hypothetical protein
MEEIICQAIAQKRLLQFAYDDLTRIVEPHLLGKKTSGRIVLSAYLVDGYSTSDSQPYWRNFIVDEMEFLVMLDETFPGRREGYNPDDNTMTEIYCRL